MAKKAEKVQYVLPEVPIDLALLLSSMAKDFPEILEDNLVGIYLWGSITFDAFDPNHSDVDCIVLTRRDVSEAEFKALERWFAGKMETNTWTEELDMRFIIDGEALDPKSKCCGFQFGQLRRHGSDANPIIWLNIVQSGITLWGKDAKLSAPEITQGILNNALLLELEYLKKDLEKNRGDRSDLAFKHNSYAVLTACRILYTVNFQTLVSKETARDWGLENLPEDWHPIIKKASKNRLKSNGSTGPELEQTAMDFVEYVDSEVRKSLGRPA